MKKQNAWGNLLEGVLSSHAEMRWGAASLTLAIIIVILGAYVISPTGSATAQDNVITVYLTPDYQEIPGEDSNPHGSVSVMMDARSGSVVFVRVAIVFNPSEIQIVGEIDTSNSPMSTSIATSPIEIANKTGKLIIVVASRPNEAPASGVDEIAHFAISSSRRAGNAEISFDDEDMQIVSSDSIELPITTEGAIVNVTSLNYYIPYVYNTVPSYEINDSFEQAFGPLVSDNPYISTIGRDDEDDYYYFDVNTLAPIKIQINEVRTFSYNENESRGIPKLTLYDEKGNTIGNLPYITGNHDDYVFQPSSVGRYYIGFKYCCNFNPEKIEYGMTVSFNGTSTTLEGAGYIMSKGAPVPYIPFHYYDWGKGVQYQSMSDSSGRYYVPMEHSNCYELVYGHDVLGTLSLGQEYIRDTDVEFCKGNPGDLDISPIDLIEPNSTTESFQIPVTFKWTVRPTTPDEQYTIYIWRRITSSESKIKAQNVGHVGEYVLDNLFAGEGVYQWYITATQASNSLKAQSYNTGEVYLTLDSEGQTHVILVDEINKPKSTPR